MAALSALKYAGGKSGAPGANSAGRWIAGQLPFSELYFEPFAGMLGVLLQRPKAKFEAVNDINGRLVNWWRCLRDRPDELLRLLAFTPHSRDAFTEAIGKLDDLSLTDVERAAAYGTVLTQSYESSDTTSGGWLLRLVSTNVQQNKLVRRLFAVAERVADVQIENRDAVQVLDRISKMSNAVVYVDPPYSSVDLRYYNASPDFAALADVLKAQTGRVAVSGYGTEWDCLGWRKSSTEVICTVERPQGQSLRKDRVEVLWLNYPAVGQPKLF